MERDVCTWQIFDHCGGLNNLGEWGDCDGTRGIIERVQEVGGTLGCLSCSKVTTLDPSPDAFGRLIYTGGQDCVDPRPQRLKPIIDSLFHRSYDEE